jgi:glucokinase
MATGGVYLGGGIPPRILPALERDLFLEAFHRKGRLGDVLMDVPVHVVLDSDIAVFGAACYGLGI